MLGACLNLCIMPHAELKNDAVGVDIESCNDRPEPEPEVPALGIGCGRMAGTDLELRAGGLFVLSRLLLFDFFNGGHGVQKLRKSNQVSGDPSAMSEYTAS